MQRARGGLLDVSGGFMAHPATRNGVLAPSPVCFQKKRWRLIARALNMRMVYARRVESGMRRTREAQALSLTGSAALCIPCATGLNRGLHDVQ